MEQLQRQRILGIALIVVGLLLFARAFPSPGMFGFQDFGRAFSHGPRLDLPDHPGRHDHLRDAGRHFQPDAPMMPGMPAMPHAPHAGWWVGLRGGALLASLLLLALLLVGRRGQSPGEARRQ